MTAVERFRASLARWLDSNPEPPIRYWMILYAFSFVGVLKVWVTDFGEEIKFGGAFGPATFLVWVGAGLTAPVLAVLAWWLVHYRRGLQRFAGMWLQLIADILQGALIFSFLLARGREGWPRIDVNWYTDLLLESIGMFMVALVLRDLWVIVYANRGRH